MFLPNAGIPRCRGIERIRDIPCSGAAQQQRTADNQHPKRLHVRILPDKGSGNDQAIDDGPTESLPQYKTAASASSCGGAWSARTPDAAP